MGDLDLSELDDVQDEDTLVRRVQALEGQLARARLAPRMLKAANARILELEQTVDVLTALDGLDCSPPDWTQPPRGRGRSRGIANLILSDLHLDEVVDLAQMGGRNMYDRSIAEMRLRATVVKVIKLCRDHISGVTFDGIVVWMLGDNGSGEIHDELRRTNAGQHSLDTTEYWIDLLVAALEMLADFFGNVRIICQIGNHGRTSHKPEAKNSVRSSYDWSLYRQLWRATRGDPRFSWNIPECVGVKETIFNTVYYAEHGDAYKGGDQIAGPIRPIMFGRSKAIAAEGPFDMFIVGDKHTYAAPPGIIMNGSMVGYSEYSRRMKFPFQPPKLAFWVETPENGPSFAMPIHPCDPIKEGWGHA